MASHKFASHDITIDLPVFGVLCFVCSSFILVGEVVKTKKTTYNTKKLLNKILFEKV